MTREDGTIVDGFDADALAGELGITTEELLTANQRGELLVHRETIPTTTPGVDITHSYRFQTPTHGVEFSISSAEFKGRA